MYLNVIDKGPRDPVAPDDPEDADAVAAHKAALKEQADWREAHPDEPPVYRWAAVDARHAVAADPKRYEIVEAPPVAPNMSLEQRVAALEAWRVAMSTPAAPPPDYPPPEGQAEPNDHRVSYGPRPGEPAGTNP